jgi:hypothetical protein
MSASNATNAASHGSQWPAAGRSGSSSPAPLSGPLRSGRERAKGLEFVDAHHEIYLSDPRRTAPKKLKTILRHPVRRKFTGRKPPAVRARGK